MKRTKEEAESWETQVLVTSIEHLDPAVPEADKLNLFVCFLSQYISFSLKPLGIMFSVCCNPGVLSSTEALPAVASNHSCSPTRLALDLPFPPTPHVLCDFCWALYVGWTCFSPFVLAQLLNIQFTRQLPHGAFPLTSQGELTPCACP